MDLLPFGLGTVPLYLLALFGLVWVIRAFTRRAQPPPSTAPLQTPETPLPDADGNQEAERPVGGTKRGRRRGRGSLAVTEAKEGRLVTIGEREFRLRLLPSEWEALEVIAAHQGLAVNALLALVRNQAVEALPETWLDRLSPAVRLFAVIYLAQLGASPAKALAAGLQAVAGAMTMETRRVTVCGNRMNVPLVAELWPHVEAIAKAESLTVSKLLTMVGERVELIEMRRMSEFLRALNILVLSYRMRAWEDHARKAEAGGCADDPDDGEGDA